MAGPDFGVRLEGVRALVQQIGKFDLQVRKELGQANKGIGQRVIDRAYPTPKNVGAGAGAVPRASASTNVLKILAGGSHRAQPVQQWGVRYQPRDTERPYLARSAEEQMPWVEEEYLDALATAARKVGLTFRRT